LEDHLIQSEYALQEFQRLEIRMRNNLHNSRLIFDLLGRRGVTGEAYRLALMMAN